MSALWLRFYSYHLKKKKKTIIMIWSWSYYWIIHFLQTQHALRAKQLNRDWIYLWLMRISIIKKKSLLCFRIFYYLPWPVLFTAHAVSVSAAGARQFPHSPRSDTVRSRTRPCSTYAFLTATNFKLVFRWRMGWELEKPACCAHSPRPLQRKSQGGNLADSPRLAFSGGLSCLTF